MYLTFNRSLSSVSGKFLFCLTGSKRNRSNFILEISNCQFYHHVVTLHPAVLPVDLQVGVVDLGGDFFQYSIVGRPELPVGGQICFDGRRQLASYGASGVVIRIVQCVHAVDPRGQITAVLKGCLFGLDACQECDEIRLFFLHKSPQVGKFMADGERDVVGGHITVVVSLDGESGKDPCQAKA